MKILVAVDSSKKSHLVETVLARPWPKGSEFSVISVVDMRQWEGLPALIEDARHEAESIVKTASEQMSKTGQAVTTAIPEGSPKTAITDYAKQWHADLIMVGSHGSNAATRFLLGSVAQSVLRGASCSVEIVRHQPPTPSRGLKILIPTDGSACSLRAVKEVATRPWPPQSEVRVLSVMQLLTADVPSFSSSMLFASPNLVDEITKISRTRAEDSVAAAQQTLSATGIPVYGATPLGDPRGVILDEASEWNADLIILGSHGLHGLEHFLIGSVAESVAAYAKCSVEVVR